MTAAATQSGDAVILSIATVGATYFDEQAKSRAVGLRFWGVAPASELWESYRVPVALAVPSLLAVVASGPFARLYTSALMYTAAQHAPSAEVIRRLEVR